MTMSNVRFIDLPKIVDSRGSLTFIEENNHIPFEIKRIYYLYDNFSQTVRGHHAHKKLKQLIIPICGSFDFILDDGNQRQEFFMDNPSKGLYVPPMMWREIENFSNNSVCLVLASAIYEEEDYYRNYQDFLNDVRK